MRQLFLFGDVSYNIKENFKFFVKSCGDEPNIAVLMMNINSKKYESLYSVPLSELNAKFKFIYPEGENVNKNDVDYIKNQSNGILMAGGTPKVYSKVYVQSEIRELIKQKYNAGYPYAGVSAGAIMATEYYEDTIIKKSDNKNEMFLVSKFNEKVGNCSQSNIGLGLIKNILLEPHFAEWGLFPAFLEKLNGSKVKCGMGFDESIGIRIVNEDIVDIFRKRKNIFL